MHPLVCHTTILNKIKTEDILGVNMRVCTLAHQKKLPLLCQKKVPKKTKAVELFRAHILAYPLAYQKEIPKGSL